MKKSNDTRARVMETLDRVSVKDGAELVAEIEQTLREVNRSLREEDARAVTDTKDYILHPTPALVDGEPIVASTLRDGRKVLVAAGAEGEPLKDKFGQYVVIDPQSGSLRYKLGARSGHPARNAVIDPAFDSNGLAEAQKRFEKMDLGALAFIKGMKPVKDLYKVRTRSEKFKLAVIKAIATVVVFFRRPLLWAKGKYFLFKCRKSTLKVEQLPNLRKYLSGPAQALLDNEIPSMLYEVRGPSKLGFARAVSMMVPLEPNGSISDEYVRRWANMMNDLVARDVWKYGTLLPPSTMNAAQVNLKFEKLLTMMIFTDQVEADSKLYGDPVKQLNEQLKYPLFQREGQLPSEDTNWYDFPW